MSSRLFVGLLLKSLKAGIRLYRYWINLLLALPVAGKGGGGRLTRDRGLEGTQFLALRVCVAT